jgi:quercetin dioxygenase-like cupin family protein
MDPDAGFSFLGRRLRAPFELRVLTLQPGAEQAYDEEDWRDALVVVEQGEVELESTDGERRVFKRGDLLTLARLPLRALRNRGSEPAVLVAVTRGRRPEFPANTSKGGRAAMSFPTPPRPDR